MNGAARARPRLEEALKAVQRGRSRHHVAAAFLAVLLFCPASRASIDQGTKALEALAPLVEKLEYEHVIRRLRALHSDPAAKVSWLRRYAEEGHPPLQSELAIELLDSDVAESLKWFTRGRLARVLDASECGMSADPLLPDKRLERVRQAAVARPAMLLEASKRAMEWAVTTNARVSSRWLCGSSALPDRAEKRSSAMKAMRDATRRLSSYVAAVEAGSRFRIAFYDTPARGSFIGPASTWLDENRLLFISSELPYTGRHLYFWDVGRDEARKLALHHSFESVCFRDGTLTVVASAPDSSRGTWEGSLESLQKVESYDDKGKPPMRFSTCLQQPSGRHLDGSHVTELPRGHGQLTIAHGRPVTLTRSDGSVIELPIASSWAPVLDYAPWSSEYLIRGPGLDSPYAKQPYSRYTDGADVELFGLWPDGRTKRRVVPYGVWDTMADLSTLYRLTRRGLIISGGELDEDEVDGWNGVFLFPEDGGVVRLMSGRYVIGAVSPSGCRIAVSPQSSRRRPGLYLRVIDLCLEMSHEKQ
jgi:hypothetical protein